MLNGLYSHSCPYGQMRREEGYTKAARRCGDLIRKRKEEYGDVAHSKGDLKFLCYIGDYVFLPLPHLINYSNSIRDKNFFKGDGDIIKKEDFTPEFIVELIKYRPEALMGGEITSYQKKEVPKFCNQLKRYMSDMYEKVKTIYPEIEDRIEDIDYRDKMAKVVTLLPGKVKLSTKILEWDGSVIKAEGNQLTFWGLSRETVIITPDENTYVQIVDNATVTDDTEFKDERGNKRLISTGKRGDRMQIYGKADIHSTMYKDLKKGDVFYFLKDCKEFLGQKIYMRCGHTSENSAVNLETGICYGFDDNEPVEIVEATLNIKQKK